MLSFLAAKEWGEKNKDEECVWEAGSPGCFALVAWASKQVFGEEHEGSMGELLEIVHFGIFFVMVLLMMYSYMSEYTRPRGENLRPDHPLVPLTYHFPFPLNNPLSRPQVRYHQAEEMG